MHIVWLKSIEGNCSFKNPTDSSLCMVADLSNALIIQIYKEHMRT